jgi:hypothetical protein
MSTTVVEQPKTQPWMKPQTPCPACKCPECKGTGVKVEVAA